MIREVLQAHVERAATSAGVSAAVELEFPAVLSHGDYATSIALAGAKEAGLAPKVLAEKIVALLGTIDGVARIEIAGPGFINFHLARDVFATSVGEIVQAGERWGRNDHVKGYRVIVEYSQPNPFKPFHIGHLMSTAVGESISRFVEFSGATIYRANYGGDIGPHVAKCIWGLQKENLNPGKIEDLGRAYVFGNSAYEESPAAKAEIDAINKRLYAGDPEFAQAYAEGKKTSIEHFEDLYRVLGTRFDRSFYESETAPIGTDIVQKGLAKGIFEESDGAVVYRGEKVGLHTRVFLTSQGTPTYEAKELGFAKLKSDVAPFDLNITTVAVEQDGFFKVVEAALAETTPELAGKYMHVTFGMMQLSSGKMSSRKGNIITGESLIAEMREKALEKMSGREFSDEEEKHAVADAVAVAAIKYTILKQARGKNIIFDPEQSLSFEGDSGPYLQYSYVRAHSVLAKASASGATTSPAPSVAEFERLLPRFPEIVFRAAKENEPHHVTTYLIELAAAFNSWYAAERILGDEHESYKLALTAAFSQIMKNGLWLLGISAPERM